MDWFDVLFILISAALGFILGAFLTEASHADDYFECIQKQKKGDD